VAAFILRNIYGYLLFYRYLFDHDVGGTTCIAIMYVEIGWELSRVGKRTKKPFEHVLNNIFGARFNSINWLA
jgi:hypothetical protein